MRKETIQEIVRRLSHYLSSSIELRRAAHQLGMVLIEMTEITHTEGTKSAKVFYGPDRSRITVFVEQINPLLPKAVFCRDGHISLSRIAPDRNTFDPLALIHFLCHVHMVKDRIAETVDQGATKRTFLDVACMGMLAVNDYRGAQQNIYEAVKIVSEALSQETEALPRGVSKDQQGSIFFQSGLFTEGMEEGQYREATLIYDPVLFPIKTIKNTEILKEFLQTVSYHYMRNS